MELKRIISSRFISFVTLFVLAVQCHVSAKEITLSDDDSGKPCSLDIGDTLNIVLAGNPTTGYTWTIESPVSESLPLIQKTYTPSTPQLCGSGGHFNFKFLAKSAGKTNLCFHYHRPWMVDTAPASTFDVSVSVK